MCNASLYGFYPSKVTDNVTFGTTRLSDVHVIAYPYGRTDLDPVASDYTNAQGTYELWLSEGNYTFGYYRYGYVMSFENKSVS